MNIFSDFISPLAPYQNRIFIIDLFRFLAIFLMIIFHTGYDLAMFGYFVIDPFGFFGFYLPRIIVTLFLLSSGLSLNLSSNKKPLSHSFQLLFPRFIKLAFFAFIISLVTRYMFPNNWVYFGTLHCLATLTLFAIFFKGRGLASLIFGAVIQLNYFIDIFPFEDPINIQGIQSVDYIPLYPWSGVFFLGMGLARFVGKIDLSAPEHLRKFISIISQKSLPIYLLHQPILYSAIALFNSLAQ